jgi:hypothetical protein
VIPRQVRNRAVLATTQVEDFVNFLEIFSTKGAEKRQQQSTRSRRRGDIFGNG